MTFDSARIGFKTLFSRPSWKAWVVVVTVAVHAPAFAQERPAPPRTQAGFMGQPPPSERIWGQLAQATWLADGQAKAPRTVYAFTDPNCTLPLSTHGRASDQSLLQ